MRGNFEWLVIEWYMWMFRFCLCNMLTFTLVVNYPFHDSFSRFVTMYINECLNTIYCLLFFLYRPSALFYGTLTVTTDAPGVTLAGHPERVSYKLGILTHRCLLGKAPVYLSNCCITVAQVATRRHLYAPMHVISWPFRDIVSALTVVGHSLSLVWWRSTLYQMICETPQSAHHSNLRTIVEDTPVLCLSARLAD